ncbi:MAG TPA: polymer-forming cytoskeletal protein [Anaerolineaceae bacterium]|nr:polymer-forming cytoskeletal protein [Anaerolineaceae bacterium]
MKTTMKILIFTLLFVVLLGTPLQVLAQTPPPPPSGQQYNGDRMVMGNSFRLRSGDVLNGDLVVMGGNAQLDEGSTVNGDVALFGGNLNTAGTIDGDVFAMGANVSLGETALITGEISTVGASVAGADDGQVQGGINVGDMGDFDFGPIFTDFVPGMGNGFTPVFGFFTDVFWRILQILGMAVLAMLVVLVLPRYMNNAIETLAIQPVASGGVGLLTMALLPFLALLLVLLAITIILIPVTIIGLLAIVVVLIFGWIVVGYEIGKLLERSLRQDWAEPVVAGIGTLVLGVGSALVGAIPCIGWLIVLLISAGGLGAVVLSRLGTQISRPAGSPPPAVISAPPAPIPPAPAAPASSVETFPGEPDEDDREDNEPSVTP